MKNFIKIIFTVVLIFLFSSFFSASYACDSGCGTSVTSCTADPDRCGDCWQCATPQGEKSLGVFQGLGALSNFIGGLTRDNPRPAALVFTKFISTAIGIMTVIAFIWFIIQLFSGTISWLGSGGDKTKLQGAQKQITTSLVGLAIVISSIFIIKIVGVVFGFDILDLTNFIVNLGQ